MNEARSSLIDAREMRKLAHQAVTEGVNLKYVERMRQALYAAADRIEELKAGEVEERLAHWIVRDEGTALAYWGPFPSETAALASNLAHGDGSDAVVVLKPNPDYARNE